ncbi:putative non-hemolytic phospholipase C [Actinocatenispora thailandica]|uniref:phospholipase C n=1 Tax=Actinocatenispora thailandica TaxID=227318 RepID=A0A7R7DLL8_9ACTN|nr:alkaline phosphatase family protein [Actinocatenispora thailandica]BCJ33974.1 putative non-hemolytic phospholipase C [Actinocatenispora thailandica]
MPEDPPHGTTRRRFLGTAGATAAGAAALSLLPGSMRKALAAPAEPLHSLRQIEHVIFLMQENRSFDHYFGTLKGVRGFDDPDAITLSTGRSVFHQPDPENPDGYLLPFRYDTKTTSGIKAYGTGHAWDAQHLSGNGGKMDNWVPTHRRLDGATRGPFTMAYYTREDLPFHYALADAFTVCDSYFCSVLGPTHPNRVMAISGTVDPDGTLGGPVVDNHSTGFRWTTYPERLQRAGISWRYCTAYPPDTDLGWFKAFQDARPGDALYDNAMVPYSPSMVADMIRGGDLPSVTWLDAQYLPSVYGLPEAAEGPGNFPAAGAEYIWTVLDALGSRPDVWAKTVFVIVYDENDGLFDHVPPPRPPEGTPGEWVTVDPLPAGAVGIAGPVGPGYRVPALVISPWSTGGWVCSEPFDHTSQLRFLERRFGVRESNISAWRRRTVGDLTSALRLGHAAPRFPRLPDPTPLLAVEQREAATLPLPTVPTSQQVPHQEPGHRPHTR